MMVLRSSAWSLPWEKVILMMLLTPFGVDLWNTLLYHLEALQLSFSPFFLCSFPTLSEGYNTLLFFLLRNLDDICYTTSEQGMCWNRSATMLRRIRHKKYGSFRRVSSIILARIVKPGCSAVG